MDLEPRLLRHFLVLSEELHFGRAATKLYVSQSALSEAIKKLELDLGAVLFVRGSRRVELTAAGKVLRAQAPEILCQIEEAIASVLATAREDARHYRVGYSPFLDLSRIWILRKRLLENRESTIEFVSARTIELLDLLLNGEIIAALVVGPIERAGLASEVVAREPFVVGLSAKHRLASRDGLTFQDLSEEDVI